MRSQSWSVQVKQNPAIASIIYVDMNSLLTSVTSYGIILAIQAEKRDPMKTLVIQTFDDEIIGAVTQDDHGGLEVQGATPEYKVALQQLIESITSKPIPYRTGEERETPEGIEHITMVKMCRRSDDEFLNALKDALPKYPLLGKRIEGIMNCEVDRA